MNREDMVLLVGPRPFEQITTFDEFVNDSLGLRQIEATQSEQLTEATQSTQSEAAAQ
jgi:hypothetical protein